MNAYSTYHLDVGRGSIWRMLNPLRESFLVWAITIIISNYVDIRITYVGIRTFSHLKVASGNDFRLILPGTQTRRAGRQPDDLRERFVAHYSGRRVDVNVTHRPLRGRTLLPGVRVLSDPLRISEEAAQAASRERNSIKNQF